MTGKNEIDYFAQTDIGKKYDHNEDFHLLPEQNKEYGLENINTKRLGYLFILCDGMGGQKSGEVASQLTATWISKNYYKNDKFDPLSLRKIIKEVNKDIFKLSNKYEQYDGMGTTLISAIIKGDKIYIYSVGDSRVYLFRSNQLKQLTEDQSEVWELYEAGIINKDEIIDHPKKNYITEAIGIDEEVSINYYKNNIEKGDKFLLSSDGLTDMIKDEQISEIFRSEESLKDITNKLIINANDKGGNDNITCIVIEK